MTSPLSDEDLVGRVLGGDENAFAQLYERYRHPIYATAYRIIQSAEDARDATQEIFVKLYRSLRSWNPRKASFSTWIYRLASNHSIDCWRARKRKHETQPVEEAGGRADREYALGDAIRSPYQEVAAREQVDSVRDCVDVLPELQKKVFILRYFQEMKLEEIAEMENCSLGTVKTSLFRATHAVRRALRKARN
jgi:RNA polymerase sigma-70 factor (ECF subfamily)